MARYFLTEIKIEGFRGINNEGDPLHLRFEQDAVNSLFAPNAQGKSSIFEALCYAIKGVVPKLEAMPASDQAEQYYSNLFHQGRTGTILLTLSPDDGAASVQVRVRRLPNGARRVDSPSGYGDPEALLSSLNTEVCLVDHRTFVGFIEDTPLRRGRSFSSLLAIGKLSEFRQALETLAHRRTLAGDLDLSKLSRGVQAAQDETDAALNRMKPSFSGLTDSRLEQPVDLDKVAKEATLALRQVDLVQPFLLAGDIRQVGWNEVRKAIRETEQSDKQARLLDVVRSTADLEELAPGPDEKEDQLALCKAAAERDAALARTKGPRFMQLYSLVLEILDSPDWKDPTTCPACESSLGRQLSPELRERLDEYGEVAKKSGELSNLWQTAAWVKRLQKLVSSARLPEDHKQLQTHSALDSRLRKGEASANDAQQVITLLEEREAVRKLAVKAHGAEQKQLSGELPPSLVALTEQIGRAEQLQTAMTEYEQASRTHQQTSARLQRREKWAKFIQQATELFSQAEVELSTRKTEALESEYQSLYQAITNNPEIVPALQKSSGSEELHLVLRNFYGLHGLSAPTVLAESYRNALAISIFLSAVLHDQSPPKFIVMDDVTSSFDAGHQFALMEVLRTRVARPSNPDGPQILILSHDGLLEKYFDRLNSEASWYHQRIEGLPPKGAIFAQVQDAARHRSRADQFLSAGQAQQAEPLVRQYLEFRLQQVIRKVNIAVPIDFAMRDDRKQVQACLDAIQAAIDITQAAGQLILDSQQVLALQTGHVPALVGNWVSHYATGVTASFSPRALLGVLDTVDNLVDCFRYDCRCSGSVKRRFYKDLTCKHCGC